MTLTPEQQQPPTVVVAVEETAASRATLLGGVSQQVLRKAPCPVLIVPETGIGMSGATADR